MRTSALTWAALIQSYHSRQHLAPAALEECAQFISCDSGRSAVQKDLTNADDQILYDAGVAATATGDFDTAQHLFTRLQGHNPNGSDAAIWLALIAGVRGDWQAARTQLKDASDKGSPNSRGLANQLFSVVCAVENRPDAMIEHMLAGQRSLNRSTMPVHPRQ